MRRMIVLVTALLFSVCVNAAGQTRTLNVGDAVISYDVTGRGRTVVFIHGWTHNKSVWDDQVSVFSKRYRVLRYDSRGYGKSTGFDDESLEPGLVWGGIAGHFSAASGFPSTLHLSSRPCEAVRTRFSGENASHD
jgi:pimeloyl-ACP methyl ester carboxylesterase